MEKIPIIILAAGQSKRLGFSKQLVQYQGDTLLNNSINLAKKITKNITVVLGANFKEIHKTILEPHKINILFNQNWETGMASSIKLAIEFHKNEEKIIIMLCDQYLLNVDILNNILKKEKQSSKPIIACEYAGHLGVPMLFNQLIFSDLLMLEGEKGASAILKKFAGQIAKISFENGVFDVDTPADLEQLSKNNV